MAKKGTILALALVAGGYYLYTHKELLLKWGLDRYIKLDNKQNLINM